MYTHNMANMTETEKRIEKARARRYKKAVVIGMNVNDIKVWLQEALEEAADAAYAFDNDSVLIDTLCGDEDEAFEFRVAFQSIEADLEQMADDMNESWIPECFDDFFCAVSGREEEYAGYDVVEKDYFGLMNYSAIAGQEEATKRLERMTKNELIEAAQQCYRIAFAYLGLKSRYEDLRAALDILRGKYEGLLKEIMHFNDLYEQWCVADYWGMTKIANKMDDVAAIMPDEVWMR